LVADTGKPPAYFSLLENSCACLSIPDVLATLTGQIHGSATKALIEAVQWHRRRGIRGSQVDGELHELTPIERHRPCMDAA